MEDSSHEPLVDQSTSESKLNRRDMAKLLGAVTALSASLGATFIASASTIAEGAQLKLKFFKQNRDPAKAELICSIDVSPQDQLKIVAADGPVELRVVSNSTGKMSGGIMGRSGAGQDVTLASTTIEKVAWKTLKDRGQYD